MVFIRDNLPRIKDRAYVISLNLKMYQINSKVNESLTTYLEYILMIPLCVDFIVSL